MQINQGFAARARWSVRVLAEPYDVDLEPEFLRTMDGREEAQGR